MQKDAQSLAYGPALLAALMLLMLSYFFEKRAYTEMMGDMRFELWHISIQIPVLIALAFNVSKGVLAWLAGGTQLWLRRFLRTMLYTISFLSTAILVSSTINDPNLDKVIIANTHEIKAQYKQDLAILNDDARRQRETVEARYSKIAFQDSGELRDRLARYESERIKQMGIVINGVWNGPRYAENKSLVEQAQVTLDKTLTKIRLQQSNELLRIDEIFNTARKELVNKRNYSLKENTRENLRGKDVAQNQALAGGLQLLKQLSGLDWKPIHLGLLVAILASAIIEFCPIALVGFVSAGMNSVNNLDHSRDEQDHSSTSFEQSDSKVKPLRHADRNQTTF